MKMSSERLAWELWSGDRAIDDRLLHDLRTWRLAEDVYLDYKGGDWLKDVEARDKKKGLKSPSQVVQAYASGFANADGGVLVVGLIGPDAASEDHPAWSIVGAPAVAGDLKTWIGDVLRPYAGYYSAQPRFDVVAHPEGDVLVVAVPRSEGLVPQRVGGRLEHFLRVGDGTAVVPEYLHVDLVLGRRQRPALRLRLDADRLLSGPWGAANGVEVGFEVFNESMAWADDCTVGWVVPDPSSKRINGLSAEVRNQVDVDGLQGPVGILHRAAPVVKGRDPIGPGGHQRVQGTLLMQAPVVGAFNFKAAIYVASRQSAPVWYECEVRVKPHELEAELRPCGRDRPAVSWWIHPATFPSDRQELLSPPTFRTSLHEVEEESEKVKRFWHRQ